MKLINCPICDVKAPRNLITKSLYPYFTSPISKKRKKELLEIYKLNSLMGTLDIKLCNNCCHCFLSIPPDETILNLIYDDYSSYPSALRDEFTPERDLKFLDFYKENENLIINNSTNIDVLDVGCFDGYILYQLKKKGYSVTGCDPSMGAEIGQSFGVNIYKEYFNPDFFYNKGLSYDIIISRHFLEHVIDPVNIVKGFKKILKHNGKLIIEVPNVYYSIEKGITDAFVLEHIQAFTRSSFQELLNRIGMNIIVVNDHSDNLLIIAEQKDNIENNFQIKNWSELTTNYSIKLDENKKFMNNICSDYNENEKTIAIWGAGSSAVSVFSMYDVPTSSIDFMIDSDSNKWDKEFIYYDIPIISPDSLKNKSPDLIIVASMYSKSILESIKKLKMNPSVITTFPDIKFYQNV